jgi:nitronate monooxygenase
MWQNTPLARKLSIRYPIIGAPMAGGATTPELVAAISNAGGLGSLGAGYMQPEQIKKAIRKIKQLTNKPFAVNLFIPCDYRVTPQEIQLACTALNQSSTELKTTISACDYHDPPSYDEQLGVIIEEYVPIFSFTFGIPSTKDISRLKNNDILLIGTATTLTEALLLEENRIDMIVAQGYEAGGHRGTFLGIEEDALIGLISLVPQLADCINIPIIASGGIMDGKAIAASFSLGGSGVQMGTAFLTCLESGIHPKYKKTLLSQVKDNTVLTRAFSGKLARGIQNLFTKRMAHHLDTITDYPIQNSLTQKIRQKAKSLHSSDFMSMWAGQSAHLCKEVKAKELLKSLVDELNVIYNTN